uniref:Cytochrome P450 n=1 Tax=Branchiostoma floridae TaxID=7739 RepID=C3Z836_BRAFL|eukprot:XP_002595338.1 hypothetical protein BRAFLDRAFT_87575 [Branchiostoma floridae]
MGGVWSDTFGLIKGLVYGPHMLKSEDEYPTAFRTNNGVPAVVLLNRDTIQYVFNPEMYEKEPFYFGYLGTSKDVMRGHCPSMFLNGEEHRQKKALLIDAYKQGQKALPSVLFKQIKAHFGEWSRLDEVPDFEDRVFHFFSEALTEALFGRKVDGQLCRTWLNGLLNDFKTWIPMPSMARKRRLAIEAIPVMWKAIEEAPNWTEAYDFDSHHCAGQDIAFLTMKATLAVLLCYCSWELKDAPVWSDKTLRVGNPDDPVRLTRFSFRSEQAGRALGIRPDNTYPNSI